MFLVVKIAVSISRTKSFQIELKMIAVYVLCMYAIP